MTSLILALVLMIVAFAVVLKQKNERKNVLKEIDEMSKTLELDETIESETIQEDAQLSATVYIVEKISNKRFSNDTVF